jgi:hypothetical protein
MPHGDVMGDAGVVPALLGNRLARFVPRDEMGGIGMEALDLPSEKSRGRGPCVVEQRELDAGRARIDDGDGIAWRHGSGDRLGSVGTAALRDERCDSTGGEPSRD